MRSVVAVETLVDMVMATVLPPRELWVHLTAAIKASERIFLNHSCFYFKGVSRNFGSLRRISYLLSCDTEYNYLIWLIS